MTTAPRPQTDVETGQEPGDAEGWALLDGLRRRLDDQATQTRKTSAQVTQLAESIGALVEAQRKRSRWLNLNSFVAYVMFTLICGGAFYYVFQSRSRGLAEERDHAMTERDAAVRRADEATARTTARDAADAKAWETWQLLEAGKRDDAVKHLADLEKAPLSKFEHEVLVARARQAELMQVDAALKTGANAFKAGHYNDVVTTLEAALALQGAAPRAPEMHYLIGLAELKSNELAKAVTHLQAAVAGDVAEDDVRFELASALDRIGLWAKSRAEYDRFATQHPQSPWAVFAMRRSATLALMPAEGPWVKKGGPPPPNAQLIAPPTQAAPTPPVAGAQVQPSPAPAAGAPHVSPPALPKPAAPAPSAAPTEPATP